MELEMEALIKEVIFISGEFGQVDQVLKLIKLL